MKDNKQKDWRKDYVICQHIAKNEAFKTYTKGFRVCCKLCYEKGFLYADLEKKLIDGLSIGDLVKK